MTHHKHNWHEWCIWHKDDRVHAPVDNGTRHVVDPISTLRSAPHWNIAEEREDLIILASDAGIWLFIKEA